MRIFLKCLQYATSKHHIGSNKFIHTPPATGHLLMVAEPVLFLSIGLTYTFREYKDPYLYLPLASTEAAKR